jgi:tetratricopeptide (TPR) repeat protein
MSGALMNLGDAYRAEGDTERAIARFEEACDLARRRGNEMGIAFALQYLGATQLEQGDLVRAEALFGESRELFQRLRFKLGLAWTTYYEAHLARVHGDRARARTLYGEALREFTMIDYDPGIAETLLGFAGLAAAEDDCERAARLLGAAETLLRKATLTRSPLELDLEREITERCGASLGDEAFARARGEGRTLTAEEAVGLALDAPRDPTRA